MIEHLTTKERQIELLSEINEQLKTKLDLDHKDWQSLVYEIRENALAIMELQAI